MKMVSHLVSLEPSQKAVLERLSRKFRRPQNDLIREAIDLLEEKYKGKGKEEQRP